VSIVEVIDIRAQGFDERAPVDGLAALTEQAFYRTGIGVRFSDQGYP